MYKNKAEIKYYSKRYNKHVTVPKGYNSDGATGAIDIYSDAWWIHDKLLLPWKHRVTSSRCDGYWAIAYVQRESA